MSGVVGIEGLVARARRLQKRSTLPGLAQVVEREYVRQMRAQAGSIPVDTGELLDAMTSDTSPDREVRASGAVVEVSIDLPQAYWQRHRLPSIDGAQMAQAIAGAVQGDE